MSKVAPTALIESDHGGLRGLIARARARSREKRSALLRSHFSLSEGVKILDLGGWDGSHISHVIHGSGVRPADVCIADISASAVSRAQDRFGFEPVVLREDSVLPFERDQFDIVFCSSVLEHVTIPKVDCWTERSGRRFASRARLSQASFAAEIRRVGKGHFVQVPYRWFPIETHTWLPFFSYLPREVQVPLMHISNRVWIKKTSPDFHLPSIDEMRSCFPESTIEFERSAGVIKSLIAIRELPDADSRHEAR